MKDCNVDSFYTDFTDMILGIVPKLNLKYGFYKTKQTGEKPEDSVLTLYFNCKNINKKACTCKKSMQIHFDKVRELNTIQSKRIALTNIDDNGIETSYISPYSCASGNN